MPEIYLGTYSNQRVFAIVDAEDILELSLGSGWYKMNKGYAARCRKYKTELMHLIVAKRMGLDIEKEVDHINRNRLDNRRQNLRTATDSQNKFNSAMSASNTSGFTGVCRSGSFRWRAYITIQQKQIPLGVFDRIEDAYAARKLAEKRYFGEFASDV